MFYKAAQRVSCQHARDRIPIHWWP